MLLRSLKSGGVAYFQLPTYAVGYHFDVASYFSSSPSPGASLEMHVLPQSTVFEIAEDEGCRVLEVQPDNCVGAAHWISNTFLVSKITPKSPNVNEIQTNQVVSPPLPLPPGFTPEALKAWLTDIRLDGAPPAEMAGYCAQDWKRFVYTWGLATECRGTALELGANPYFTTCLLVEFTKLNLSLANYFGPDHNGVSQSVEYRKWGTNEFVRREFGYSHFNVEADVFPFPNESFDVVLWCEVLEHLQRDPLAALREINRVLKPGGKVILTTPNACRLESVARMISGTNVQDAYSGYGAYGRHNREYTRDELSRLLAWAGFTAEVMFTADVYANPATFFGVDMDKLLPMLDGRKPDLGQYIFSRSTKTQPPRAGRPSFLFRSWPPGEIVDE
jgi:SAM-dependent methyltransferase